MSLKIILGGKDLDYWKASMPDRKYMGSNDAMFDRYYKPEWFNDTIVQEAMHTASKIDISKSSPVMFYSTLTEQYVGIDKLSTGCKTLILAYKFPNLILRARMGDNCTDLMDLIASKVDVVLHSYYVHMFKFKHIKEIEYLNYGIKAHNAGDILDASMKFFNYENKDAIEAHQKEVEETLKNIELADQGIGWQADGNDGFVPYAEIAEAVKREHPELYDVIVVKEWLA